MSHHFLSLYIHGPGAREAFDALNRLSVEHPVWENEDEATDLFYASAYTTWDTYESDLSTMTKLFPDVWATLEGEGDGTDEHWQYWFAKGRYEIFQQDWNPPQNIEVLSRLWCEDALQYQLLPKSNN